MTLVALEEHFVHPDLMATYDEVDRALLAPSRVPGLDEIGDARIAGMDAAGIDVQVLSHTKPGAHEIADAAQATALTRAANDYLAQAVARHPRRLAGFATLAPQAPADAAAELRRSVRELGFKGAMLNGHVGGRYLDDRFFWAIFEEAQALNVPIYLHPANPHPAVQKAYYDGYPVLGYAPWGYAVETATHVLRLILSGLFKNFPHLQFVIGHMGEMLPFALWRADGRLTPKYPAIGKPVRDVFRENFWITTSGVFSTPEFQCTAQVVGYDRMLFSVDYPFESNDAAVRWFDTVPMAPADRERVAWRNAQSLLGLDL